MQDRKTHGAGGARVPAVQFRLLRAAAASPAMLGGLLLVPIAAGGLGAGALLVVLNWVSCGGVALTGVGNG